MSQTIHFPLLHRQRHSNRPLYQFHSNRDAEEQKADIYLNALIYLFLPLPSKYTQNVYKNRIVWNSKT